VPVIIIEADDRKAAELSLIENLQRENLNPIEEASAFKALIEEYDLTQEEVSSRIGKSRSAVANSMRLLDLPKEVLELVKGNDLSAGHARALLGLTNRAIMPEVAKKVIAKGLSVRLTEDLVRSLNKKEAFANKEEDVITEVSVNYIADLEKRVASHIGRIIKIREKGKKKRLEIEYSDNSDLENIIKKLCGSTFFDD